MRVYGGFFLLYPMRNRDWKLSANEKCEECITFRTLVKKEGEGKDSSRLYVLEFLWSMDIMQPLAWDDYNPTSYLTLKGQLREMVFWTFKPV